MFLNAHYKVAPLLQNSDYETAFMAFLVISIVSRQAKARTLNFARHEMI